MIEKIKGLETLHKAALDVGALRDLRQARADFQELLGLRNRRKLFLSQLYQFGNKSGRLLARAQRAKTSALQVHNG